MSLDPVLVASAEEAERRNGARGDELDGKDGVDLADELVTNLDRGFGYGTTELFGVGMLVDYPREALQG